MSDRSEGPASRRILLLGNPASGSYRPAYVERLRRAVEGMGGRIDAVATASEAELVDRAGSAAAAFDVVGAYGGDGTVNAVVNGALGSDVALAVVRGGTANVLARELGVPGSPEDAARMLVRGPERPAPVGIVNGRAFTMMVGFGFDADAVRTVDPKLKARLGIGAYAWAVLNVAAGQRDARVRLELDGVGDECGWAVVSKIRRYGGDWILAPDASLWDDTFQVVLFDRTGFTDVFRHGLAVLAGRMGRYGGVRYVRAARVRVLGPADLPAQVDGEVLAASYPVDLRVSEERVRWIVPR